MGQAREFHTTQTHFLRKTITYADDGLELEIGRVPAGAVINKASSGIHVVTAFDAGSTNVADIGTNGGSTGASDDPDLFGTDMSLATKGFVPLDETGISMRLEYETILTVSVDLTGTAATAGEAEVIIEFYPDIDK